MTHYFLTYNDDTHFPFMQKLVESVRNFGPKFKINIFNKSSISPNFIKEHKNILELKRGGGYWLWKPYIINETMKKLNDGDVLFYLDSKYYFTENFEGLYKPLLDANDIVVWKNKPNDNEFLMKNWCKMDVIQKYNMYDKVFIENANDCWAGAICIKKNSKTLKMMEEWLNMCCNNMDITDAPSAIPNSDEFIEHRHDQSMLSIVLHKNNIPLHFFEKRYLQNVRNPY
jgi:hypothetical protein